VKPPRHVCLVSQWYPPEPVDLPEWIAAALSREGWAVQVLTGMPNYPRGVIYEGFQAWHHCRESRGGLSVLRCPLFPSHGSSALGRAANYLSWAISATFRGVRELRAADVNLVYSSPATAAIPAVTAKLIFGRPYVLIVQDLWPDSIFASGFLPGSTTSWVARSVIGGFARLVYSLASSVSVISPGMYDELARRGVEQKKLHLIYNWVNESCFRPTAANEDFRSSLGIEQSEFVLMYAGNHGAAQDLGNAIDALSLLSSELKVHLILVGDGVEKPALVDRARQHRGLRVHFLPPQPAHLMAPVMAAADFQLVSLRDSALFRITMPSKVQAILASGSPVIVCAPGDAARVVADADCGLSCPPGDPESLAAAIVEAVSMTVGQRAEKGRNARAYYCKHMAETVGVASLSALLAEAVGSNQSVG